MLKILFLFVFLCVGVYFANDIAGENGYVVINTVNDIYKLSPSSLVIGWVLALGVIYIIQAIISKLVDINQASFNYFTNRQSRKAEKHKNLAYQAFNEGDQQKTHRLLGKNASISENPLFNLLYAFNMAYQNGDFNDAQNYLEQAKAWDNQIFAVQIADLQMQIINQNWDKAKELLEKLLADQPKHAQLLRYAILIFSQQNDYANLNKYLSNMAQANILADRSLRKLYLETLDNLFQQQTSAEDILDIWKSHKKVLSKITNAPLVLIKNLLDKNAQQEAYSEIIEQVKRDDTSPELHNLILRLELKDTAKLCKLLANQAKKAGDMDIFYRDLGYLYAKAHNYKLAEQYFEQYLSNRSPSFNDAFLASFVYEQNQNFMQAEQVKKQTLNSYLNL